MSWIKDGKQVTGKYYGRPFEGVVTESRVMYGGDVEYKVALHYPIHMSPLGYGDLRSSVLVGPKDLKNKSP